MRLRRAHPTANYDDDTIIQMLFENERTETAAIQYLLQQNKAYVSTFIFNDGGTPTEVNTLLNDGLVILINNVKALKFKGESSLNTYFVGICKLLWKRTKTKNVLYATRNLPTENLPEEAELSALITRFEQRNENDATLRSIYALLTEKCRAILDLWAKGFSMKEISDKMSYKNAQIAMNKKNKCLKGVVEKVKSWNA